MVHLDDGVGQEHHLLLEGTSVLGQGFLLLLCLLVLLAPPLFFSLIGVFAGSLGFLSHLLQLLFLSLCLLFLLGFILLLALKLRFRQLAVEALVGLLEEGHVVVEFHQVERSVECHVAVGVDGVSVVVSILVVGSLVPGIGRVVVGVGVHPVEYGQQVERQLIGCGKRLIVVERCTEVLDACPHRVLPGMILVGVEIFVDGCVRLLYLCVCGTAEVGVQVLGEVPAHGELSVPEELLAERERQLRVLCRLHVALLQLVVVARHLGVERHILRQPVQSESLQYVEPLAAVLYLLERLPRLVDWSPRIVERSTPVVLFLVNGGLARGSLVRVAVGEGEVGRVVWHGVTLGGDSYPCVGDGEVGIGDLSHGDALYGVALVSRSSRVECVLEFHVGVHRVVLGRGLLLGDAVI